MSHLSQLKQLAVVNLTGTKVTDAGLVHFEGTETPKGITLIGTQIGDASIEIIAGWAKVKHVRLQGTKVTAVGLTRLAAKLPECRIEWDGGIFKPKGAADPVGRSSRGQRERLRGVRDRYVAASLGQSCQHD